MKKSIYERRVVGNLYKKYPTLQREQGIFEMVGVSLKILHPLFLYPINKLLLEAKYVDEGEQEITHY
jgi:hypothetical protein